MRFRSRCSLIVFLLASCCVAGEPKRPPGTWDAARADKFEQTLDAFFAEPDAAKRAEFFRKELQPQDGGLGLEELEAIAKAAPPEGERKGNAWRVQYPWLKDNPRAWFNLTLPEGYTPKKSWGLLMALHSGPAGHDGNNMMFAYTPILNNQGYFVVYPTITDDKRWWGDRNEMSHVYRIIDWMARRYRIDFRRLLVSGGSAGGIGTWNHLVAHPEVWAAGASGAAMPGAQPNELERLRGIPFYLAQGENDPFISNVRAAVAGLKKLGIEPVFVEVPKAEHQLPPDVWHTLAQWLPKQPPKPWSPRPLFFPPAGKRSLWQIAGDPLGIADDPALAFIRQGKAKEARTDLDARLRKGADARAYLLRAMAQVPALAEPLPDNLDPKALSDTAKGWGSIQENSALSDLSNALHTSVGKEDGPKQFDALAQLLTAKIWAKRFAATVGAGGIGWVQPYQDCVKAITASNQLDPTLIETVRLAEAVKAKLPALKR